MVLRSTDNSKSVTTGNTWQSAIDTLVYDDAVATTSLTQEQHLVSKAYVDYVAFNGAGVVDGSILSKGVLQLAKSCGATGKDDKGFSKFADYNTGFAALKKLITNVATGNTTNYKPTMTLMQFFSVYALSADNND
jgi:hypothetical protein